MAIRKGESDNADRADIIIKGLNKAINAYRP